MPAPFSLRLLGAPSVSWRGRMLTPGSARIVPLLAYAALNPGGVSRPRLIEMLWEDGKFVNLRQELRKIRMLPGADEWFADPAGENVQVLGTVDVLELRAAAAQGQYKVVTDAWPESGHAYVLAGLDLSFLPARYLDWLEETNTQLAHVFAHSFQQHAAELEAAGNLAGAIQAYRRLAELDPLAETAHRAIIRLEMTAGRLESAWHQLDVVRTVMHRELGSAPGDETQALAERLAAAARKAGEVPPVDSRLPAFKSAFLGRRAELRELGRLFDDPGARILTITGMGGVGKSRLALEFAQQRAGSFPGGLVYMSLTERTDLLPAGLATLLGLEVTSGDIRASVLEHLDGRRCLLLFDNLDGQPEVARFLSDIAGSSPGTVILCTSQVQLNVQEERVFTLTGMDYPAGPGSAQPDDFDAIAFFRQQMPGPLEESQLPHVVEICRLLDGLPLGVELAAALTGYMTCREIAAELARGNYGLLSVEHIDRPHRHRTLKALLQATWQLLEPDIRSRITRLSVFSGPFSREDARAVAAVSFPDLRRLIARSLLAHEPDGMLRLHPSIRWFATEELERERGGRGLRKRLHQRAARHIMEGLDVSAPRDFHELAPWLDACHHLVAAGEHDEACRLLISFDVRLLLRWGQAAMVLQRHEELHPHLQDPHLKGRSLNSRGLALSRLGRLPEAISAYTEALGYARQTGDRKNEANYLGNSGIAYSISGKLHEAIAMHEAALELSREMGDRASEGIDLGCVGLAWNRLGDVERAITSHTMALEASRAAGDRQSEANHLGNLARIFVRQSEHLKALAHVQAALVLRRELGDRRGEAIDLHCLAEILEQQDRPAEALARYQEALALNRSIGERIGECETLMALGRHHAGAGRHETAHLQWRAALLVNQDVGDRHVEGEILSLLADLYSSSGDSDTAAALWITAWDLLPEQDSVLGQQIRASVRDTGVLQDGARLQNLLWTGNQLLHAATGLNYAMPHVAAVSADFSA